MNIPMLIALAALFVIAVAAFALLKKRRFTGKKRPAGNNIAAVAPLPQAPARKLSPLERSWEFLTHITELVTKRFSKVDQKELLRQGKVLMENGLKYQHIVDNSSTARTQTVGKTQQQQQQQQKGHGH